LSANDIVFESRPRYFAASVELIPLTSRPDIDRLRSQASPVRLVIHKLFAFSGAERGF
jgi:hypothetical protein